MFAGKKSAQIREILISESAWEEMTCLFAPSLGVVTVSVVLAACQVNNVRDTGGGAVSPSSTVTGVTLDSGTNGNP